MISHETHSGVTLDVGARLVSLYGLIRLFPGARKVILDALSRLTEPWGVTVETVQMKNIRNIRIDSSMIRAMGRKAEAARIREPRLIEADA